VWLTGVLRYGQGFFSMSSNTPGPRRAARGPLRAGSTAKASSPSSSRPCVRATRRGFFPFLPYLCFYWSSARGWLGRLLDGPWVRGFVLGACLGSFAFIFYEFKRVSPGCLGDPYGCPRHRVGGPIPHRPASTRSSGARRGAGLPPLPLLRWRATLPLSLPFPSSSGAWKQSRRRAGPEAE
jgi:hypothetical protein